MNILNISLDAAVTDSSSSVYSRVRAYSTHVDTYTVIVPHHRCVLTEGNLTVYGVGGHKVWQSITIAWHVWRWCRRPGAKVITIQDSAFLAAISLMVARCMGVVCEVQIHGFERQTRLRRLIARWVMTHANAIRVVSERLKQKLISELGVSSNNISVAPIALPAHTPFPLRDYDITTQKIFTFICVARLVSIKRIDMQIDAMMQLRDQNVNCQLWIIGDGPERHMLSRKIIDSNLQEKIFLLGHIRDVNSYYAQADAFVLTSDAEGWGVAVIEAAHHGLPIIMTDVGCAGEVIRDGYEGIVIPIGDSQALYRAMYRLVASPELRRQYGTAAQKKVSCLPNQEQAVTMIVARWQYLLQNNC